MKLNTYIIAAAGLLTSVTAAPFLADPQERKTFDIGLNYEIEDLVDTEDITIEDLEPISQARPFGLAEDILHGSLNKRESDIGSKTESLIDIVRSYASNLHASHTSARKRVFADLTDSLTGDSVEGLTGDVTLLPRVSTGSSDDDESGVDTGVIDDDLTEKVTGLLEGLSDGTGGTGNIDEILDAILALLGLLKLHDELPGGIGDTSSVSEEPLNSLNL